MQNNFLPLENEKIVFKKDSKNSLWKPNNRLIKRDWEAPPDYFFSIFSDELFDLLARIVNRNMEIKKNRELLSKSYERSFTKVNKNDMKKFYGMIMLIENFRSPMARSVNSILNEKKK